MFAWPGTWLNAGRRQTTRNQHQRSRAPFQKGFDDCMRILNGE
jgi:hypothetical protein